METLLLTQVAKALYMLGLAPQVKALPCQSCHGALDPLTPHALVLVHV